MTLRKVLFWGLLLVAVCSAAIEAVQQWQCGIKIEPALERAQTSSRPEVMEQRLNDVLASMEYWGITSGHTGIPHTQANDVGLDYQAIRDLRDRAKQISQLDPTSDAYQNAMIDMRQTLGKISFSPGWFHITHSWLTLLAFLAFVFSWLSLGIVFEDNRFPNNSPSRLRRP